MLRWIKFSVKYRVQSAGGPVYEAGQVEQMGPAGCRHFVSRGLAEYCDPPATKPNPEKVEPPEEWPEPPAEEQQSETAEIEMAPKPRRRRRRK